MKIAIHLETTYYNSVNCRCSAFWKTGFWGGGEEEGEEVCLTEISVKNKETNHTKNWQKRCQQGIQNKHMSQWRTASFFGACKTERFGYLSKKLWRVCIWKMLHKWYRAFLPLWTHLLSIHFFYFMFTFHLTRHLWNSNF